MLTTRACTNGVSYMYFCHFDIYIIIIITKIQILGGGELAFRGENLRAPPFYIKHC